MATAQDTWTCIGQVGDGKLHSCCVHEGRVSRPGGQTFRTFGCCWCNNALVDDGKTVIPPLPEPAPASASHGPLRRGTPVARRP